jgi:DNA invertase Pin-like site-specific DNA recombinase
MQARRRQDLYKRVAHSEPGGDQTRGHQELDRLGRRSLENVIERTNELQRPRRRRPVVLDQGIDTSTGPSVACSTKCQVSIAEFEHAVPSDRTVDGLARLGPVTESAGPSQAPTRARPEAVRQMNDQVGEDGQSRWTLAQIAAEFGVTRPTIYRYLDGPEPAADNVAVSQTGDCVT